MLRRTYLRYNSGSPHTKYSRGITDQDLLRRLFEAIDFHVEADALKDIPALQLWCTSHNYSKGITNQDLLRRLFEAIDFHVEADAPKEYVLLCK